MSTTIRKITVRGMQRQLHGRRLDRKGLTLVELLAVISIIGILASMVLVAMRGAQEDAIEAKTRSTISKIHEVIAAKYETYLTHPLPIKIPTVAFQSIGGNRAVSASEMSRIRLTAIRDLMRLEMPDRPSDVKLFGRTNSEMSLPDATELGKVSYSGASISDANAMLIPTSIFCRLYEGTPNEQFYELGRIPPPAALLSIRQSITAAFSVTGKAWETNNSNSELLYLIISQSQFNNGNALELFGANEVADTDEDGLKEFIDGWGNPICWIRWPAGLDNGSGIFNTVEPFDLNGELSLDPMDPLLSDIGFEIARLSDPKFKPGKGLFPLIISSGGDKRFGMVFSLFQFETQSPASYSLASGDFSISDFKIGNGVSLPSGYPNPLPFPDPYFPRYTDNNGNRVVPQPGTRIFSNSALSTQFGVLKDYSRDNVSNLDEFGAAL